LNRVAHVIDGVAVAAQVRTEVALRVRGLVEKTGIQPALAVILVGDDPASQIYVRNKVRQAASVGIRSLTHTLSPATTEANLLAVIRQLNEDESIHGILVQFPLPQQISVARIVEAILPQKDVDGFNPLNVGRSAIGIGDPIVPCTPRGVLKLIKAVHKDLTGLSALVLGASNIVGKPMARLLLHENCTVSIAHIHTQDVPERCREADILVVATGVPGLVRGSWIKPGGTVIDVGITRVAKDDGTCHLVGDVNFSEALKVAGAVTPVPGGVGPMTVASLLVNTLEAAERSAYTPSLAIPTDTNSALIRELGPTRL